MSDLAPFNGPPRYTTFPIKFPQIWEMHKRQEATIWHADEVDLKDDLADWEALDPNSRAFLTRVLAFFAASDMIVAQNLAMRFTSELQEPEITSFYAVQNMMESVHSEVYSKLIDTYITDAAEKDRVFNAVLHEPCIAQKAAWAEAWIGGVQHAEQVQAEQAGQVQGQSKASASFAARLVAFAIVEGIFFSGSFCAIYWLSEQGKLKGLCLANDYIAKDEGMHVEFACLLYGMLHEQLSQEEFATIMREAVDLEIKFITVALRCDLLGINSRSMAAYIRFCANRLAQQLGHDELYADEEVQHGFEFMDRICLANKTNFFEGRVTEYRKFDNTVSHGIGNVGDGGDEEDEFAGVFD